ncbi:GNAT family N-acetyltransferase [Gillisia sp. M10.2A]|uniref:GNAT family N-acetyltransferase n=1 Tax=Gillisia lutea TaxID=2909668 RepID=A0ABS9EJN6_9FLAO|nr:GNAT family N-acetyltransferase [Gillisia lutea]MCF4102399.1 GNAT family N-acetyltransferase [Gillisia lutea]
MASTRTIKLVSETQTYKIRQEVLRPGKPINECIFRGDKDEDTFHLGLYESDELIGVASFMKICNPLFSHNTQYQLRGMAILPGYQGKGDGSALLKHGELVLKSNNADTNLLLWFNAREHATAFYEKHGYITIGEKFDIPGVCPHIVMYKRL